MKCPQCLSENPAETKFCGECGTPLPLSKDKARARTETLQTPLRDLSPGSTFAGRYQIIEELGHGGMGKVYKVFDTKIKEKVALKLIKPEVGSDQETLDRFATEIRLARKIAHRNVCRMFDLGEAEGAHFITMEYVHGEDLKSMFHMTGTLSLGMLLSVGKQVCGGLAEAHSLGIVHRDLKPQNIMIDKSGIAKIMDFGIARSVREKGITGPSVMIGTPEYMSPEQAEAMDVDHRSDIYSLGIILYEMATSRLPFEGETALSVAMKHKGEVPRNPKQLNPSLPEDLSGVILKCLEKDRNNRYQNAADVRAELERIEKGIPTTERVIPAAKPMTSREITVKFTPRKLFLPALGFLALAGVVLVGLKLLPRKEASLPGGSKPVLAVMYFKNNTGVKAYDVWRQGLSTLLITGLSQSKYLNVLPASDIYGILKKVDLLEAANYAPEDLKRAAAAGRANHTVTGSLSKAGDVFRIDYAVQDLGRGKTIGSGSVGGTGEDSILTSLGDDLVRKIKADLNLSVQEITAEIEKGIGKITTSSAEAFKLYLEGRRLHQNGSYRDSIAVMEKALALDPEFAMAYRSIAGSYLALGYQARRIEYLEKALQYADRLSDPEKLVIQAQYAQSQRKTAEAIAYLQKGLSLYPDNEDFSIGLGNQWNAQEEFAKAAEILESPRKNRSTNFLVYSNLASAYAGLSDYDRAAEVIHDFIDNVEDISLARLMIARYYIDNGKLDLALAEVDRAATLDPRDRKCGLVKSRVLLYKNDLPAAEQELRPLLDASEPDIKRDATIALCTIELTRGRFRKAIEQLESSAALAEKAGEKIWEIRAKQYLTYIYATAVGDYRRLLELNDEILRFAVGENRLPMRQNALSIRAMGLAMMRSFPEALEAAEESRRLNEGGLNKKLIRFYFASMGKIELARNDLAKAIKYSGDSLALFSFGELTKPAWVYDTLAQAYFREGDTGKARAVYEKILALTSGRLEFGDIYARSFYWLGKICEKQGDTPKARENYRRFLDLWKDADAGLPEVADATKRLAELKSN